MTASAIPLSTPSRMRFVDALMVASIVALCYARTAKAWVSPDMDSAGVSDPIAMLAEALPTGPASFQDACLTTVSRFMFGSNERGYEHLGGTCGQQGVRLGSYTQYWPAPCLTPAEYDLYAPDRDIDFSWGTYPIPSLLCEEWGTCMLEGGGVNKCMWIGDVGFDNVTCDGHWESQRSGHTQAESECYCYAATITQASTTTFQAGIPTTQSVTFDGEHFCLDLHYELFHDDYHVANCTRVFPTKLSCEIFPNIPANVASLSLRTDGISKTLVNTGFGIQFV